MARGSAKHAKVLVALECNPEIPDYKGKKRDNGRKVGQLKMIVMDISSAYKNSTLTATGKFSSSSLETFETAIITRANGKQLSEVIN